MENINFSDSDINLIKIKDDLNFRESNILSPSAALNKKGVRRKYEENAESDYRQSFSIDVDRILHSLAYTRYIDKTQVFYLIKNDHITHRVLHVQLLSKIARTIGRFLHLNEDLIEAISLGHDIGHPPFGHEGERILSELCQMHGIGRFLHSVQSIQFLDKVERDGTGWNLCLETLDGIFCHDGETHIQRLVPDQYKTFKELDAQILQKISDPAVDYMPMTLEGCVVRMADTISYIGRDLEDAIRLNLVKRSDLPEEIIKILGNTNGKIVYNLVTDVIKTSYNNPFASFSHVVSEALTKLRAFNLEHIYLNPRIKQHLLNIRELYFLLFERFFEDIKKNNQKSLIYSTFLKDKSRCYIDNHKEAELVRDFIAGMTDGYFLSQCPESLRPGYLIF